MRERLLSAVVALGSALALVLGLAPQPAHAEIPTGTPAGSAARWLLAEATNGTLPRFDGEVDWQLTSDAVLGLAAAGATNQQLKPFLDSLEWAVHEGRYGMLGSATDGGSLAKLLVVANATGRNPRSFGGVDLVARVTGDLVDGRVGNSDIPGNTFGQSYVVLGLLGAGQGARPAVMALMQQQCPSGDFRLGLGSTNCTSAAAAADRDVTAIAIHALRAAQRKGLPVTTALNKAVTWLAKDQAANGSWIGSPGTNVANTNTTGLAAQALAGVKPMATSKAAGFTRSLQLASGAVAYDADAFGKGISANRIQWIRATTQALFALVHWDVYSVEGTHLHNGRQWRTTCEPYSQTFRCRTEIQATTVVNQGGKLVKTTGWTFNNLTYLPSARSLWASNPLGNAPRGGQKEWTSEGRRWKTECDTPATGRNGCRSYVWARFVAGSQAANGTWTYSMAEGWIFNNITKFS
ncbi:hypothetical protein GCM10028820_33580 [Tessaracoccus terricola]